MVEGRRDDARVPFDRFGRAMLRAASATAVARDDASTAREGYLANDLGRRDTRSDRLTEQREKTVGVLLLLRSDRVTETDANLL